MSDPPFPPARVGDDLIRSDVRDPRESPGMTPTTVLCPGIPSRAIDSG
jgi:hypothetical protein